MNSRLLIWVLVALGAAVPLGAQSGAGSAPSAAGGGFTLRQVMDFPFPSSLTASQRGQHIAWTADLRGVRNVFVADGPDFRPIQLTHYTLDDGQPIAALQLSPDGKTVVYARGSEWNALGHTADPDSSAVQPQQQVWSVTRGHAPVLLGEMGCSEEGCENIAMSPDGKWVVWPARDLLWIAPTLGRQPARMLAWVQGKNVNPVWSPDSKRIAFVSERPGHSLIAVYDLGGAYVHYVAPSVDLDSYPRWSPDGSQIVFIRQRRLVPVLPPPDGPEPADLEPGPIPRVELPKWELWVADANAYTAHRFWESGTRPQDTLYRSTINDALQVGANHEVLFSSEADGWNHLYSVSDVTTGDQLNQAKLLTPGAFEFKSVTLLPDKTTVIYASNQNDVDRRHLWQVPLDGSQAPQAITRGASIEWSPVETGDGKQLVCLGSTAITPPMPYHVSAQGRLTMIGRIPTDFPEGKLVTPAQVIFPSTDGLRIHGQLFRPRGAGDKPLPTLVFVHGGSERQMM
ncbi:MAG: S9 family peptidase, partial [Terriglobales bacterium]